MTGSAMTTEIRVRRDNLRETSVATRALPPLENGQVLVHVERFALTANNVSYGLTGDMIGYWRFYPTQDPWGVIPVWGFADVIESRCDAIAVGERIWGFLPMASHAVLSPASVRADSFVDDTPHRRDLPPVYNQYRRTSAEPADMKKWDDARCLYVPLFSTAFILTDWLEDNRWFGAKQVLIGSASSRTGFGLADLLSRVPGHPVRVIGLTSKPNEAFVRSLGTCDEVVTYDNVATLDPSVPSAFVDMSGSASLLSAVHGHFQDRLGVSCQVGATHWDDSRRPHELPGPVPQFFFAPTQIIKREQEWGPGELLRRAMVESLRIVAAIAPTMRIAHVRGPEACRTALDEMVAGRTPPTTGVILALDGTTAAP
ncbi:MAG TPA: DUF2855 family protein [Candidatus Binatia bacterium]|jgi:hypothetical protein